MKPSGAALAALVNLVGPEVVIIAGEGVDEFDFASAINCSIVLRSHTFDDWSRGAAVAVIRRIATGRKAA